MLAVLGYSSRAALIDEVVRASIRRHTALDLPLPRPEAEALALLRQMVSRSKVYKSFIGQGYYPTHAAAVIRRNVLENRTGSGTPRIRPTSQKSPKADSKRSQLVLQLHSDDRHRVNAREPGESY